MGASPAAVVKMVVGQGARLALIGACLGLVGALGLTRLISSLLFGTSASDPATFAVVATLLIGISLLASFVPAQRAAQIDPAVALRSE
jgi:ABC-type antimicrobial peptide transport system permease subunit